MHLDWARMDRSEWTAVAGGLLLVIAVFLPWYGTSDNPNAEIDGGRGDFSAWEVHPLLRWLLLAAAAAPLILAWIVLRDHELSWPRGEMTAVVAMVGLGSCCTQASSAGRATRARRSRSSSAGSSRSSRWS